MNRTIRVTGKGKISVKPDTIRLTITQSALEPEYDKAIKKSADKNELLAKAVEDSKNKAEVLSKAAGVSLKEIISIDNSWGEIDFITRPVDNLALRCIDAQPAAKCMNLDIEPDDIDVTDTVTVVWSIE